ncbi:MAG: hypothetical protein JO036_06600 [Candidatus Eremiobacteraeota bacterium]|nr:hypothetical protein [Candidatus Eremiobacteraeota bacterium]
MSKKADVREDAAKSAPEGTTSYVKPEVKTLDQRDVLRAVAKGSKFPARGFAG